MAGFTPLSLAAMLAASAVIALMVLWLLGRVWRSDVHEPHNAMTPPPGTARFLFRKDLLLDQDAVTETLPGLASGDIHDWSDLRYWFDGRFGPLPASLDDLEDGETRDIPAVGADDHAVLALSRRRDVGRIEVTDPDTSGPLDQHRARHLDVTLARYQAVFDRAPCAVRILDDAGRMIWQNACFAEHDAQAAKRLLDAALGADDTARVRLPADEPEGKDRFFEVAHVRAGDVRAVFATDLTEVAKAETVRREFIQTLTKIFANLTTGLAVFDRHRRLALFNPALLDLTGLSAAFLSAQPPLMQFFDSLRDNKVLPEPKNYATWRKQIETMITTAAGGLYLEDWHLPNSMTYRVTGRPHPDGAIAFLFEDITDNVSLARHFRGQIALREAVLDASDQAKAVFGPDNVVTLCNLPCRQLLGIDPEASFADMSLGDFLSVCRETLPGDALWDRVGQAVLDRGTLGEHVKPDTGPAVLCRVQPLPGNSAIITLRPSSDAPVAAQKALT